MSELQIVTARASEDEIALLAERLEAEDPFASVECVSSVTHTYRGEPLRVMHAARLLGGCVVGAAQRMNFYDLHVGTFKQVSVPGLYGPEAESWDSIVYTRQPMQWPNEAMNRVLLDQWHEKAVQEADIALEAVGQAYRFGWPEAQ